MTRALLLLTLALAAVIGLTACGGGGGGPVAPAAAPTLTAPANASSPKLPVTLTWTAVTGAASYVIETGPKADLSLGIETPAPGPTLQFVNLPVGTTLYWRAAAKTGSAQGPWSSIWSFTPQAGPPPPPVINPPALVAPAYGDSVTAPATAAPLTFQWTTVTGASGYTVQVAQNSAFSPLLQTASPASTSWQATSLPTGALYWRVLAKLSATKSTAWSVTGTFKVGIPPSPLLGTWEAVSATRDGSIVGVPTALGFPSGNYQTLQFQVSPSVAATLVTYHQGSSVSTASGTWSTGAGGSGSYTVGGVTTNFAYSLSTTNLLNLTTTSSGHTIVTRWVKQTTLTGLDPNLDTTWVAVSAQRTGIVTSLQDLFHLTYSTNQQTVQFLATGIELRRELNGLEERPLSYHLQSAWATGAGTLSFSPTHYSPQQSAYYTFGSDGSLITTTLDTTYGTTDVVTWHRWPVVAGDLPANVVGTWNPTAVTINGSSASLSTYLGWHPGTTSENFEFYPDGALEMRELAGTTLNWAGLSSWYYLTGTLDLTIGTTPANVQYVVAGSDLTLTESGTPIGTLVYTMQRVP